MISVADLIQDNRIPGNYYNYDAYLNGDLELGILENRRGDRLIAVPDTLIEALYEGLEKETGQAARLVLLNCGKWWGKNFYTRFSEEVSDYYNTPLADMDMLTFTQCLKECWKTHGWGKLDLDPTYQDRGFPIVKTTHSPYAKKLKTTDRPSCFLEAGILTSFFSRLVGRDLLAVQIACETMGAEANWFVLGLPERLRVVDTLLEEGLDREAILQRLLEQ